MPRKKITFNDVVFQQDLKAFANNFCQAVAEESKYYIWEFARKQIDAYYAEYEPMYYNPRTDQERKYSFHIFSERAENSFRGGIIFDNSAILHENAGVSEDYIENMVWNLGYHGHWIVGTKIDDNRRWEPINGEPNRLDKIREYVQGKKVDESIFPKEKIIGIALNKAKKQKYSILHF